MEYVVGFSAIIIIIYILLLMVRLLGYLYEVPKELNKIANVLEEIKNK